MIILQNSFLGSVGSIIEIKNFSEVNLIVSALNPARSVATVEPKNVCILSKGITDIFLNINGSTNHVACTFQRASQQYNGAFSYFFTDRCDHCAVLKASLVEAKNFGITEKYIGQKVILKNAKVIFSPTNSQSESSTPVPCKNIGLRLSASGLQLPRDDFPSKINHLPPNKGLFSESFHPIPVLSSVEEIGISTRGRVQVQICGVLPKALNIGETVLFAVDLRSGNVLKLTIQTEIKDSILLLKVGFQVEISDVLRLRKNAISVDEWSKIRKIEVSKRTHHIHLLSDDSEIDDLIGLKNRPEIKDSVWTDLKQKNKNGQKYICKNGSFS